MTEQQERKSRDLGILVTAWELGNPAPSGTGQQIRELVDEAYELGRAAREPEERKLPLIGREASLIRGLAKQIHREGVRGQPVTPLSDYGENGRGWHFEVHLKEPGPAGEPTGRVARVTVTLDRVYRYCATHGRQHDDDRDRTCRWE